MEFILINQQDFGYELEWNLLYPFVFFYIQTMDNYYRKLYISKIYNKHRIM